MKINVSDIMRINGASLNIAFDNSPVGYDLELDTYSFSSPIGFTGKILNDSGVLKLNGTLVVDYEVKCSRCLKSTNRHEEIEIREDIVNARKVSDPESYTYPDNYFEMDRIIKDNIILSMPMKQVCSIECKGLCPVCGSDLNTAQCGCDFDNNNK